MFYPRRTASTVEASEQLLGVWQCMEAVNISAVKDDGTVHLAPLASDNSLRQ